MADGTVELSAVAGATPSVAGIASSEGRAQSIGVSFRPPPLQTRFPRSNGIEFSTSIVGGYSKRAFDVVVSASALVALAPVLVGIWALVRIDSPGPGLFKQRRGGFEGRPFRILKFRTMRTCESRAITQAKQADARTTALGRFLRKFSIDELPQLINVLKGDMSLIGPRPHALAHDRQFCSVDRRYALRHRARPGITGLAQVSGSRGPTDTEEKIVQRLDCDLAYVSGWSWKMDISIFFRTVRVLLSDRTAF
jgi:lipopolysaccharide/colanic/teichoic acid biosynthesis glycosyltransferase